MSASLSFWELLALGLGPALLTAAIALLAPYLIERRTRNAEKDNRRAEKFEELVESLYEHKHWLTQHTNAQIFGKVDPTGASPFPKLFSIANVYFPKLSERVDELDKAAMSFLLWSTKAAQKRLSGEKNFIESHDDYWGPYSNAFKALLTDIKSYAITEFVKPS